MSALSLIHPKDYNETYPHQIEYPDIIIEKILHHLGTTQIRPVNITQISTTLGYSQLAVHTAASALKDQHIYFVTEKVLFLMSKIDVAFDTISQNINSLEKSLDRSVCIDDFAVRDVQNALQVFVDLCVSSNFGEGVVPGIDAKVFSSEAISSSAYCLSSAIKTFVKSAEEFASNRIGDTTIVVQAIVESVFSITDLVLRGLSEMKGHERVFENQNLIMFSSAIGKLKSQRFQILNSTEEAISPFTDIVKTTKTSMENLPLIMDANFAVLLKYILTPQEAIPAFISNESPIKILQSNLRELSQLVHSIYESADSTAYSVDTSSQNLIATIAYLTNSVAALPSELIYIREFHELIEPNFQANLLFITSNIRTLNDEITLTVQRRLVDLICSSSSVDKTNLKKLSLELQSSVDTIISTYEKVIRSTLETVRNHMYCVYTIIARYDAPDYDTEAQILLRDTSQFIADLDRILSNKMLQNSTINDNAFTICTKAFEEAAQSPSKLKAFSKKSIEQIERYLM